MTFSPNAATVYADGPSSDPYQPPKPDIRALLTQYESAIDAYSSGAGSIAKDTRANLFADLAHAADVTAWVYADTTVAYNGIYRKIGASGTGSWSLILPLPFSFIIASDVGAGTPNTIQATTSVPVNSSALVWVILADTNTATPVTISFNGGSPLTIKTNTGNNPAAGGLLSGMVLLGIVSGSTFRLVSDQVSSAIVAAAEAAQAAAEAAAAAAAASAAAAAASALPYPFQSVAAATAAAVPVTAKRIRTLFHTPNFVVPNSLAGGAHYRRISFADLTGIQTQAYFRSADRFMPDGTTDSTNGGYWIIDETRIDWRMFGVQCDGSDETTKCQAVLNFCMQQSGRIAVMTGTVYVSKLTVATGFNGGVIQSEECTIMGIGAAALSAVFEVQDPNINMTGRLVINAQRNSNYVCGFRLFNATATQGGYFRDIVVIGALTGFIIGSTAYPSAIVSETTIENPQTYSCPVAMEVMGGETYVTVSNPQLSADSFGGNAGWAAHEKIGIRNWGATVMVQGGEVIDTVDTNGKIFHFVPIDRGSGRVEWGTLNVVSTTIETAAPLCVIDNLGLAINNAASGRRGAVYLTNLIGYHSQDLVGFIYVPPAYQDFLVVDNPNFWKSGAVRTQPNIYAVGSPCEITVNGPFGPGFPTGLGAIQGGRVNFSRREIVRATNLNGQSFPSSGFTVAKFQTADTSGDKARFSGAYSPSMGLFTVPDGGLDDVMITASLRMAGSSTGTCRLIVNSTEILRVAAFTGSSNFTHSLGNMTAGATISVDLQTSVNDTGINSAALSVLSVTAKRGSIG